MTPEQRKRLDAIAENVRKLRAGLLDQLTFNELDNVAYAIHCDVGTVLGIEAAPLAMPATHDDKPEPLERIVGELVAIGDRLDPLERLASLAGDEYLEKLADLADGAQRTATALERLADVREAEFLRSIPLDLIPNGPALVIRARERIVQRVWGRE